MIEVELLSRTFGSRTALAGVTFRVAAGDAVMLLGPNGAGKTTLLRVLSGFLPATSGFVQVAGHDLFDASLAARAALGYVPETAPLYAEMRVAEYLRFRGHLRRLRGRHLRRRTDAVVEQCGLLPHRRELIGALSRGQRVRVAVADALLHEPSVLLLDDPLAALDTDQRRQVLQLLESVRGSAAMLISTHLPDELTPLCGRLMLLRAGQLVRDAPVTPEDTAAGLRNRIAAWLSAPVAATPSPGKETACTPS
jgi:ABC-2 type transport system ATP-binding protein